MTFNSQSLLLAFLFCSLFHPTYAQSLPGSNERQAELVIQAAHRGRVLTAVISEDGSEMASGGQDGEAKVWALDRRPVEVLRSWRAHAGAHSPNEAKACNEAARSTR